MGQDSPTATMTFRLNHPLLGFTNSTLYTGDIDYVDMPAQGSYWILPLSCAHHRLAILCRRLTFIVFRSCERARHHYQPSFWIILLRSYRHWYNSGWRTFGVHFPDLRPNTRLGSRNGQFPELLHLSYIPSFSFFQSKESHLSPFSLQFHRQCFSLLRRIEELDC